MSESTSKAISNRAQAEEEIDLLDILLNLWEGKWIIIGTTLFFCIVGVLWLVSVPSKFTAFTDIEPLTSFEGDSYERSNALGFFIVTPDSLLEAFIDQLRDVDLLVEAAMATSLIEQTAFDSDAAYSTAVLELVESFQLLPPINEDGIASGDSRRNWQLVADYHDRVKWLAMLRYLEVRANTRISASLQRRFNIAVGIAEQNRNFEIEDLASRIENVDRDYDLQMMEFEQRLSFELEDISTQIVNALADYDRATADRLAFLREQAAIARELGVAKNTIEAQTFAAQNGVLTNLEADTPFYLRGYEAIEKEIELIASRENKDAFVEGLRELQKSRRKLQQDQTIARSEQEKMYLEAKLSLRRNIRDLEQDQIVVRAKELFYSTPVWAAEGFQAAQFTPEGTSYFSKSSKILRLLLIGLFSAILASSAVIISGAVRARAQLD